MDTIKFVIEEHIDEEYGYRFPTINIYINQNNLIHLVEQVERGERAPLLMSQSTRQSYVGLHPGYHRDFRNQFLGKTKRSYSIVLVCTCLVELCSSIVARIVVDADTVTWCEIKSPFGDPIDYSNLGPFVFDRRQYLEALNMLEQGE